MIHLAVGVLSLVLSVVYLWFVKPSIIVKWGMRFSLWQTGLVIKYTQGRKYRYCYAERGQSSPDKASILFIHGFSASKDQWVAVVRRLPVDIHVLVLDLPGHGDSSVPAKDDDPSLEGFAEDVHEFAELVGLTRAPFHLVGTSMGGVIVSLYAFHHAKDIDRLTLMCPSFQTPETTEFMHEVRRGEPHRLLPDTVDGMIHMLDSCFYNKNIIPKNQQILQGSLDLRKPKHPFFNRLFESMMRDLKAEDHHNRLERDAMSVTCPTQIIWGKQDELIHVSGADRLKELLPNVQRVDLFDECGHSLSFERPGNIVKHLLLFRGEYVPSEQKKNE